MSILRITETEDERGQYLICAASSGRDFLIDPSDADLVLPYNWNARRFGSDFCWYVVRRGDGKTLLLHRVLMGVEAGFTADHRDGDSLNNRRYNLRVCTMLQNEMNRNNFKRTASGYRGVYQNGSQRRWYAVISIGGQNKKRCLGGFDDPESAARAWDAAALALRSEFTQLNFPAAQ